MMNLEAYKELTKPLLDIPALVELYEARSPSFADGMKAWLSGLEPIMRRYGLAKVSEVASARARIVSAERGLLTDGSIVTVKRSSPSKQQYVGAVAAQALDEVQRLFHSILLPYEGRYMEAAQITRRMIITCAQKGLLNGHFREGGAGVVGLFRGAMGDAELRPLGSRVLELVSFEDVLKLLDEGVAEWAESYRKYFAGPDA